MNEFLREENGQTYQSIPVAVFYTDTLEYLYHFTERPAAYEGAKSIYAFLPTIAKKGNHGEEFHYRTPNVDVAGWLIARVTGMSPAAALRERIWIPLGAEADAYLTVDDNGTPWTGSGLNARLRAWRLDVKIRAHDRQRRQRHERGDGADNHLGKPVHGRHGSRAGSKENAYLPPSQPTGGDRE